MIRLALALGAVLAAGMVASLPGLGAGHSANPPLTFSLAAHAFNNPVDYLTWCGDCFGVDYHSGSPWVVNPLSGWPYDGVVGCAWDTDDGYQWFATDGTLAAGASAEIRNCRYAGPSGSLPTDIYLTSPSENLAVSETWAWDGGSVTATTSPIYSKSLHRWVYFDCVMSPQDGTMPKVEIPGSNGGYAIPQLITVRIANPTGKTVKVGGLVEAGWDEGWTRGCSGWRNP